MQDMPSETLGNVQGRLRRPKISCGECEATGSDIRLFVFAADDRGAAIRVLCTGCGSCGDFPAKWVRPQSVSAGVHASVAKAAKSQSTSDWRRGIPETLTPPLPRKKRRTGRGRRRIYEIGAEPWVQAGMGKTSWYAKRKAGKL